MNIKKIITLFIISLLYLFLNNSTIKDHLFATVGNKAITHSDIVNEVKIILILNGQTFSEERRDQLESAAIKSTIERRIKEIELEKYDSLEYSKADLNARLNEIASYVNMDLDTLKITAEINNVDFEDIVHTVKTELLWNSLIFSLYNNRLSINLDEIDEQLRLIDTEKKVTEYLLSEIIIKPVKKDQLNNVIEEIKNKINSDGFEKVALEISISDTAIKGGNLGWVDENIITGEFKSTILNTPIGEISNPVLLPEGVLIFKVRDKKVSNKYKNLESAKDELINAEKTKILNMFSLSHYDKLRRTITITYR